MDNSRIEKAIMEYSNTLNTEKDVKTVLESIKAKAEKNYNKETLYKILNCIDITSLHTTDTEKSITEFTEKVNKLPDNYGDKAGVAAICVYPSMVKTVKETLKKDNVHIASVSGGFPHSQTFMEVKVAETLLCINDGADEIDVVLSLGKFMNGDIEEAAEEINELKDCCKDKHLKVILESGAIKKYDELYKASVLALEAGADFIKTSTGKQQPAATPEAAIIMCTAIKDFYEKRGEMRGFKAAGGISTAKDAVIYYTIVEQILGSQWLNNKYFRIGASSLANDILTAIEGKEVAYF